MINGNRIIAWCVHAYTALGLVIAALMAVLIVQGGEEQLQMVLLLLLVSLAIDSTDGWLARTLRVTEHVPEIDGRRLDDIIDFHTYTSLPLLLIWRSGVLSAGSAWLLLVPLVASIYGFSQTDAKTGDHYFLGFPSYWNVIALYIVLLRPEPWLVVTAVLLFSALTFIPSKYLHTSHPGRLSLPTNILGVLWGLLMLAIVAGPLEADAWILASLAFPLYYLAASWIVTLTEWRRGRGTVRG
ncbi:MAG: CDP-alcohol phosphatidyltransferase [Spirochaetes bacterium]|jgi:phosphatidylcholine synthase|nr:CDP-alcohol phosphatidyltransferase [Spirochaetota bacterium]